MPLSNANDYVDDVTVFTAAKAEAIEGMIVGREYNLKDRSYNPTNTMNDMNVQLVVDAVSGMGGGTVVAPQNSQWDMATVVNVPTGVTIVGVDKLTTVFKATSGFTGGAMFAYTGGSHVAIKNMTIDMNQKAGTCITFAGTTDFLVDEVILKGVKHAGSGVHYIACVSSGTTVASAAMRGIIRNFYIDADYVFGPGAIYVGSSGTQDEGGIDIIVEDGTIDCEGVNETTNYSGFGQCVVIDMKPPSRTAVARTTQQVRVSKVRSYKSTGHAFSVIGTAADITFDKCIADSSRRGRDGSGGTMSSWDFLTTGYPTPGSEGWDAGTATYSRNITFKNCTSLNSPDYAFGDSGSVAGSGLGVAYGVRYIGCFAYNSYGWYITGAGSMVLIGCEVEGNSGVNGFVIKSTSRMPQLTNCIARKCSTGLLIEAGAQDATILGGQYTSNATANVTDAGTRTRFRNVLGYITEAHGLSAVIADGGVIAHGLAAAPTYAAVTATLASHIATVTGIDATNLTVAIKTDAGAAGTNQALRYKAEM